MIFDGQVRRPRKINLGNKPQATRESLLKKAEEERRQRQEVRLKLEAARTLQRHFKVHRLRQQERHKLRDLYVTKALDSQAPAYAADFLSFVPTIPDATSSVEFVEALSRNCVVDGLQNYPQFSRRLSTALIPAINVRPVDIGLLDALTTILTSVAPTYTAQVIEAFSLFAQDVMHLRLRDNVSKVVATLRKMSAADSPTVTQMLIQYPALSDYLAAGAFDTLVPQVRGVENDPEKVAMLVSRLAPYTEQAAPLICALVGSLASVGRIPETLAQSLNGLYDRKFLVEAARMGCDVPNFAQFLLALMGVNPNRKTELLMYVSVASNPPVIRRLWNYFRDTNEYRISMSLPGTVNELSDSPNWSVLQATLELYSYWLVVANDAEIFRHPQLGLSRDDFDELAEQLRNTCFTLLWYRPDVRNLMSAKAVMLTVMRQIYVRDCRRNLLDPDFWIMKQHLQNFDSLPLESMFEKYYDRYGMDAHAEDSDSDMEQATGTPSGLQDDMQVFDILSQAPFFIPFYVRARIFHGFIQSEKSKSYDPYREMYGTFEPYTIRRQSLLEDAVQAFTELGPHLKSKLRVQFESGGQLEQGIDGGGLTKEILTSICDHVFKGQGHVPPVFATLFVESPGHTLYPNPVYGEPGDYDVALVHNSYRFLGQAIAKCLYENIMVDVEFAPFFLQKWAGSAATKSSFDDFYMLDPAIYNSMVKIYEYTGDVEDLALDFTVPGTNDTVELKPNGANIPVTNSNRLEYIHAIANYRLNVVLGPQTHWFLKGMSDLISLKWLKMFSPQEIQTLISGNTSDIDVDDLMANSVSSGFRSSHTLANFWTVVKGMTPQQRGLLLKFVTSVPKGPLLGFKQLSPRFGIRCSGPDDNRLPTASTCMNLLKLPEYSSIDIMRQKLIYSIESRSGFDLS